MSKQSEFFTIPNMLEAKSGYLEVKSRELHPHDLSDGIASIDDARERWDAAEIERGRLEPTTLEKIGRYGSSTIIMRDAELAKANPLDLFDAA